MAVTAAFDSFRSFRPDQGAVYRVGGYWPKETKDGEKRSEGAAVLVHASLESSRSFRPDQEPLHSAAS